MTYAINQNDLYTGEKRPTLSAPELITSCPNNPINAYRAMLKDDYVVTPYRDYHDLLEKAEPTDNEFKTLSRKPLDSKKKHKQKIALTSRRKNRK